MHNNIPISIYKEVKESHLLFIITFSYIQKLDDKNINMLHVWRPHKNMKLSPSLELIYFLT